MSLPLFTYNTVTTSSHLKQETANDSQIKRNHKTRKISNGMRLDEFVMLLSANMMHQSEIR